MKYAIGIGCAVIGTLALTLVATEVVLQVKKNKAHGGKKEPYTCETKKLAAELYKKKFGKKYAMVEVPQNEVDEQAVVEA